MHCVLVPLLHQLFVLGNDDVTIAELAGFVTGAIGVWLTVRRHIANFPVGLANNLFFLLLFLDARLFADAWLQVVYLGLGAAGWWAWLRLGPGRTALTVHRSSVAHLTVVAVAIVAATAALTVVLRRADDVAPFWDALTTSISLGAQWLLNLKRIESWALWAVADCIYVPLYASKDLVLTAIVYALFLAMCVLGAREWLLALRSGHAASAMTAPQAVPAFPADSPGLGR
jgi:nicotinamide mononucleotide transporter